MLRQRGRVGLVTAALVGLVVSGAQAQVVINPPTTDQSASILIFPKVIADGTRDTIIQITNTGNTMVNVHCFYLNGAPSIPFLVGDPVRNPPLCTEVDFDFLLTKQQPTHWVVSRGRTATASATADQCSNLTYTYDCNDAGLFTGQIPPVVDDPATGAIFTGELKCIEVDMSGRPMSGNHLKGEAEIETSNVCDPTARADHDAHKCFIQADKTCTVESDCADTFDVSKYNAIGLQGNENNNGDNVLCLGGSGSDQCQSGPEYDACPAVWIANHYAEDAPDPVAGFESSVDTRWTFVPCTENFETQQTAQPVFININLWNEYESRFSTGVSTSCWTDVSLGDSVFQGIFDYYNPIGTAFVQSRLASSTGSASGFVMVQSEEHETADEWESYADANNHVEGLRALGDVITIPFDQLSVGGTGTNP